MSSTQTHTYTYVYVYMCVCFSITFCPNDEHNYRLNFLNNNSVIAVLISTGTTSIEKKLISISGRELLKRL